MQFFSPKTLPGRNQSGKILVKFASLPGLHLGRLLTTRSCLRILWRLFASIQTFELLKDRPDTVEYDPAGQALQDAPASPPVLQQILLHGLRSRKKYFFWRWLTERCCRLSGALRGRASDITQPLTPIVKSPDMAVGRYSASHCLPPIS